jgi:hypothetical protein
MKKKITQYTYQKLHNLKIQHRKKIKYPYPTLVLPKIINKANLCLRVVILFKILVNQRKVLLPQIIVLTQIDSMNLFKILNKNALI